MAAGEGGDPRLISSGSRGDVAYVLPRHPAELDRLDIQHYALLEALVTNHAAQVRSPSRVLNVSVGTGHWAYDLCMEFPEALGSAST